MTEESRRRAQQQTDGMTVSAQLIAEHQTKNRDRRVSAVQYQHVGVARHDGSRVRAASIEADDHPLLSSAASISGAGSGRPDSLQLGMQHGRDRSTTSFQSVSSLDSSSSDIAVSHDFEVISLHDGGSVSQSRSRASSAAPSGTVPAPAEPPPNYEEQHWGDAPPYESPVLASAPQLPRLQPIPSIRVSPTRTPTASPRP
jgi:hypothetical protein